MLIEIRHGDRVALTDADDFTRLSIRLHGITSLEERSRAIELVGLPADEDHLYLAPETLVALAGTRADDASWRASFDGMLGYAQSKGWLDEAGRVRVHIDSD